MRIALYAAVIACLIRFPQHTARAAADALTVWGLDVVPSLFPYMVFCRLLSGRLREQRIPAAPCAALLGLLGGSPSGASVLAAYGESLPRRTLLALCALTGTISPMFTLGTVQAWTQDEALSRLLLLCQMMGAAMAGACVYGLGGHLHGAGRAPRESACAAQDHPIAQSVDAVLQVGGCIVLYSVLAALLRLLPFAQGQAGALLHALLEISGGAHALSAAFAPGSSRAIALAAACGFSGLSILSQNLTFLRPLGVRMTHLLAFAALRALSAAGIMALLYGLIT